MSLQWSTAKTKKKLSYLTCLLRQAILSDISYKSEIRLRKGWFYYNLKPFLKFQLTKVLVVLRFIQSSPNLWYCKCHQNNKNESQGWTQQQDTHLPNLIPALKYNINSINNLPHKPKFTSKPKIVFFHILFLITSNQNWMEAGKSSVSLTTESSYSGPLSKDLVGKCFLKRIQS